MRCHYLGHLHCGLRCLWQALILNCLLLCSEVFIQYNVVDLIFCIANVFSRGTPGAERNGRDGSHDGGGNLVLGDSGEAVDWCLPDCFTSTLTPPHHRPPWPTQPPPTPGIDLENGPLPPGRSMCPEGLKMPIVGSKIGHFETRYQSSKIFVIQNTFFMFT